MKDGWQCDVCGQVAGDERKAEREKALKVMEWITRELGGMCDKKVLDAIQAYREGVE